MLHCLAQEDKVSFPSNGKSDNELKVMLTEAQELCLGLLEHLDSASELKDRIKPVDTFRRNFQENLNQRVLNTHLQALHSYPDLNEREQNYVKESILKTLIEFNDRLVNGGAFYAIIKMIPMLEKLKRAEESWGNLEAVKLILEKKYELLSSCYNENPEIVKESLGEGFSKENLDNLMDYVRNLHTYLKENKDLPPDICHMKSKYSAVFNKGALVQFKSDCSLSGDIPSSSIFTAPDSLGVSSASSSGGEQLGVSVSGNRSASFGPDGGGIGGRAPASSSTSEVPPEETPASRLKD